MREDPPRSMHRPLLDEQLLLLLRDKRADVEDLLEMGGEHDEDLVNRIADDLVGARLVIRAALAVPPPDGISGAAREKLRHREREAGELLRVVLVALHPWRCEADALGG